MNTHKEWPRSAANQSSMTQLCFSSTFAAGNVLPSLVCLTSGDIPPDGWQDMRWSRVHPSSVWRLQAADSVLHMQSACLMSFDFHDSEDCSCTSENHVLADTLSSVTYAHALMWRYSCVKPYSMLINTAATSIWEAVVFKDVAGAIVHVQAHPDAMTNFCSVHTLCVTKYVIAHRIRAAGVLCVLQSSLETVARLQQGTSVITNLQDCAGVNL